MNLDGSRGGREGSKVSPDRLLDACFEVWGQRRHAETPPQLQVDSVAEGSVRRPEQRWSFSGERRERAAGVTREEAWRSRAVEKNSVEVSAALG